MNNEQTNNEQTNTVATDSITTALNNWLLQYEPILEIADTIHTGELGDNINNLALQRLAVDITQQIIGQKKMYTYALYIKSESENDTDRTTNLDWLDDLSDWILNQNRSGNLPTFENKVCVKINCDGGLSYITSEDGAITDYYIQIYITIR